ncbi:hypothetical protein X975_15180, partial [Stegodyphus mimosarum]
MFGFELFMCFSAISYRSDSYMRRERFLLSKQNSSTLTYCHRWVEIKICKMFCLLISTENKLANKIIRNQKRI